MTRKTVTRTHITEALHRELGLSHDHCRELLDGVLSEVSKALVNNEEVKLSGFASFYPHQKNQRMGRNLKTGEKVVITPRRVVVFRPSANLKNQVNKGLGCLS